MLERERQRTSDAQQQLAAERKLHDETRKRYDARIEALINEQRAERRIADAERRIADERAAATQQAMLTTIAELAGAIADLRRQNNNGNDSANGQS